MKLPQNHFIKLSVHDQNVILGRKNIVGAFNLKKSAVNIEPVFCAISHIHRSDLIQKKEQTMQKKTILLNSEKYRVVFKKLFHKSEGKMH